ncbi:MAG: hypothetical protein V4544_06850 [Pseudomonadota bacterium]
MGSNKLPIIIPGTRYGNLVTTGLFIPEKMDGIKRIRSMAQCKCDCGVILNKEYTPLKIGRTKNCSNQCIFKKPKIIPGTRFGVFELTGTYVPGYKVGKQKIHAKLECKCDCGIISYKQLIHLKTIKYTHCCNECILYEPPITPGVAFGNLVTTGVYKFHQVLKKCIVECKCSCGSITNKQLNNLKSGVIKSCGTSCPYFVSPNKTHGLSRGKDGKTSKVYKAHHAMMQRCYDPKHHAYENYGGRGILVSPELQDLKNFCEYICEYVGEPGSAELSLDRIDNERGYEKGNLRWATASVQLNNRRTVTSKELIIKNMKKQVDYLKQLLLDNNIEFYDLDNSIDQGFCRT